MKKVIFLTVLLLFHFAAYCQNNSVSDLSTKMRVALKQKDIGKSLFFLGVGLEVAGLIFYLQGLNESNDLSDNPDFFDANIYDDNEKIYGGAFFLNSGEALIATGVSLWIAGFVRHNIYKRNLNRSEKGISLKFDRRGIGLQLNF